MNHQFRDYWSLQRNRFGRPREQHFRRYVGLNQFRIAKQLAGAISGAAAAHFANKDSNNLRGGPPLPPQDEAERKALSELPGDDLGPIKDASEAKRNPAVLRGSTYDTPEKKRPVEDTQTPSKPNNKRRKTKPISEKDMESAGTSEDVEMASNLMAMRAGASTGNPSAIAHETPVTIPRTISYGFPDTWTAILPLNLTFNIVCEGPKRPAMLSIRMNSIYDCIANGATSMYTGTVSNTSSFGSLIGTQATTGTSNDSYISNSVGSTNLTTGNQQPAWRPFFESHYDKYHVMGCEWELSCRMATPENGSNSHRIRGALATIYHGKELPPVDGITLADMLYWKNLDQVDYVLPESAVTPMGSVATHLQGRYKPGEHKHEVREDEEARTWTDTGANPTLQENLSIYFCEAPLSWVPLTDDVATSRIGYNCFLTLKYIVQWKDLKKAWQYPTRATNTEFITSV